MNTSNRVNQIKKSAIHEMTRLSKQYDDVAFLSWAKPTTGTPKHINDAVIEYNKPEGSYLMFPKILGSRGNDSITFSKNLLKEARVSTTPGIAFGPTGENHIRLSFCVPEEMINKAFDRMEKYFKKSR